MNCKDFKEIADSYLSNELLVETNHEVLQHLENCVNCRHELGARRELRDVLRSAVKNAPHSQINPSFAFRLKNNLRENSLGSAKAWNFFGAKAVFASLFTFLILAVAFGIIWRKTPMQTDNLNPINTNQTNINLPKENFNLRQADFSEARKDAIDDHKNCALTHNLKEKPISLNEAAKLYGTANKNFDTAVMESLHKVFGDNVKFIKAHFCLINNRRFAHVVIEFQKKIVSILMTEREKREETNDSDAISCQTADNLQIACFESGKYRLFVVSDLPETDNLLVARTISPMLK
ncbi:MAG TPA: zf-HC2 domain-containing protein, partial [Pyrinomonadaceae bacterium]|nr:zf-HC2 domain-containing protein [Pyrinomonadaceae bacterium]